MGCYTSLLFDHFTSWSQILAMSYSGWDGGDFTFESCCGELRPEGWDWRVVDGRLGLEVHGKEMGDHVFLLAMFGFSWNGPPFHISFQMCIKSFWGCLAGCHIHFQRLDKLCRGQCGRCIYWYHFYWVEAVKQFDFPSYIQIESYRWHLPYAMLCRYRHGSWDPLS